MNDYFGEALKEFAALSESEYGQFKKQKSEGSKQVVYKNFCELACQVFSQRLPEQTDRVQLYQGLLFG